MASVNVKIIIGDFTKVFRFSLDTFVADAINEIQHKLGQEGGDHGLYQSATKGKKARWLKNNRTLKFYNVINDTELEYKKKHRILKIKLPDESQRSVLIDASLPIRDIIQAIGEKLMIKDFDQYGIRRPTASETEWLDSNKSLCEEDVPDDEILLFAKKLFYNDFTVDKDDPMQLHLIYVQASNSVVNGKYDPLQRREVIDLAAMQAQIVYGNYDATRYQKNSLDLAKLLPASWRKDKKIEKDILKEYQKLVGTNEINAKYRYLQIVRSLKTYGIAFFEVLERVKGKKKMQKSYLGITRDRILKMDGETRETVKEWGIEQLRRWAPTSNSLTLDFGDYEDDYVMLQTEEGDQMSRMIADYIDITLKDQVGTSQLETEESGKDAHVGSVMAVSGIAMSSITSSLSANYTPVGGYPNSMMAPQFVGSSMVPNVMEHSAQGMMAPASRASMAQANSATQQRQPAFPQAQSSLVTDLSSALENLAILNTELEGGLKGFMPGTTLSAQQWRNQLDTNNQELSTSVTELLELARGDPNSWDLNAINAISQDVRLKTLGTAVAVKHVAALDNNASLLSGVKAVSQSMVQLFSHMQSQMEDPHQGNNTLKLNQAEDKVNLALFTMKQATDGNYVDEGTELFLQECVVSINSSIEDMVSSTISAIADVSSPELKASMQNDLDTTSAYLDWVADSLSSLVAVASTPESQSKINEITGEIQSKTSELVDNVMRLDEVTDPKKDRLQSSRHRVNECVSMFNLATGIGEKRFKAINKFDLNHDNSLFEALSQIRGNIDSPKMLVNPTKASVNTMNNVTNIVKDVCDMCDPDAKERMTKATRNMARASESLLQSVKTLNINPSDQQAKDQTLETVSKIESYFQDIQSEAGPKVAMLGMNYAVKSVLAKMLRTKDCLDSALIETTNPEARTALTQISDQLNAHIKKMFPQLAAVISNPEDAYARQTLQRTLKSTVPVVYDDIVSLKRNQKNIPDLNKRQELNYSCDELSTSLKRLDKASRTVVILQGQPEFEEAMQDLDVVHTELEAIDFALSMGNTLSPVGGTNPESARVLCQLSGQALVDSLDKLIEEALNKGSVSDSMKDVSSAMTQLMVSIRGMAGSFEDVNAQKSVIGAGQDVFKKTLDVIRRARAVKLPEDGAAPLTLESDSVKSLKADYDEFRDHTRSLLGTLSNTQGSQFIDDALSEVLTQKAALVQTPPKVPSGDQAASMANYVSSVKGLSAAASELVNLITTHGRGAAPTASLLSGVMARLIKSSNEVVSSAPDKAVAQKIIDLSGQLTDSVTEVLGKSKDALKKGDFQSIAALKNANDALLASIAQVSDLSPSICADSVNKIMEAMSKLEKVDMSKAKVDMSKAKVERKSLDTILNDYSTCSQSLGSIIQSIMSSRSRASLDKQSVECASLVQKLLDTTRSVMVLGGDSGGDRPEEDKRLEVLSQHVAKMQSTYEQFEASRGNLTNAIAKSKAAGFAATDLLIFAKQFASTLAIPEQKPQQQSILRAAKHMANSTTTLVKMSSDPDMKDTPEGFEQLMHCARNLLKHTHELENAIRGAASSGKQQQQPSSSVVSPDTLSRLVNTSKQVAFANANLLDTALTSIDNKQGGKTADLDQATEKAASALGDLMACYSSMSPGVRELSDLEATLLEQSSSMSSALVNVISGKPIKPSNSGQSSAQIQAGLADATNKMSNALKTLSKLKTRDSQQLSKSTNAIQTASSGICNAVMDSIAANPSKAARLALLRDTKQMLDTLKVVVQGVKAQDAAADPEQLNGHIAKVSESLTSILKDTSSGSDLVETIDNVSKRLSACFKVLNEPVKSSKSDVNTDAVGKEIQKLVSGDLMSAVQELTAVTPGTLPGLKVSLPRLADVVELISKKLMSVFDANEEDSEVKVSACKNLLNSIQADLTGLKTLALDPTSLNAQVGLSDSAMRTFDTLSTLVDSLRGEMHRDVLCDRALEGINRLLAQVSSASMFVTVNQAAPGVTGKQASVVELQSEINEVLNKSVRASLSKEGKPKTLGRIATSLHEDLEKLADLSLRATRGMNSMSTKQSMLSSIKALGHRVHQYIVVSRNVEQNPNNLELVSRLESTEVALRQAIDQFSDFSIGIVEDQNTCAKQLVTTKRGLEAILARDFKADAVSVKTGVMADQLLNTMQTCSTLLTDLVLAASQADVVTATCGIQKAIESLVSEVISVTNDPTLTPQIRADVYSAVKNLCRGTISLLDVFRSSPDDAQYTMDISEASSDVSAALQSMYEVFGKLPNMPQHAGSEFVGINVDERASEELTKCAKVLEDACKSLMSSLPQKSSLPGSGAKQRPGNAEITNGVKPSDGNNKSEHMVPVVTGALEITKASARLIIDATNIQNERSKQRRVSVAREKYRNDPTWANGLISASRSVAFSVQQLVSAAQAAAKLEIDKEVLIASVHAVSSSTAHLVSASRVKADPNSAYQISLSESAGAVNRATAELFRSTKPIFEEKQKELPSTTHPSQPGVSSAKAKFDQQIRILRLEAEVERERRRLADMKKSEYKA